MSDIGGYSLSLFPSIPPNRFICSLCLNVMRDPFGCTNGHNFCQICIKIHLSRKPECPVCRVRLLLKDLVRNIFARESIAELQLRCEYFDAGCSWLGTIDTLSSHPPEGCGSQVIVCPNSACEIEMERRRFREHNLKCKYSVLSCGKCGNQFQRYEMASHMRDCIQSEVKSNNRQSIEEQRNIQNTLCALCNIPSNLVCGYCKSVYYCSNTHQNDHRTIHEGYCKTTVSSTSISNNQLQQNHSGIRIINDEKRKKYNKKSSSSYNLNHNNSLWVLGLHYNMKYDWLIDCYRLRAYNDFYYGSYSHGLYEARQDLNNNKYTSIILNDFFLFVMLASKSNCIPCNGWNWLLFYRTAENLIKFPFELSDANSKYGHDNLILNGRSLAYTADIIYGGPIGERLSTNTDTLILSICEPTFNLQDFIVSNPTELVSIGGGDVWNAFIFKFLYEIDI